MKKRESHEAIRTHEEWDHIPNIYFVVKYSCHKLLDSLEMKSSTKSLCSKQCCRVLLEQEEERVKYFQKVG